MHTFSQFQIPTKPPPFPGAHWVQHFALVYVNGFGVHPQFAWPGHAFSCHGGVEGDAGGGGGDGDDEGGGEGGVGDEVATASRKAGRV